MAAALHKCYSRRKCRVNSSATGKLYRQQRICKLGTIFYRFAHKENAGQSGLAIFKRAFGKGLFILTRCEFGETDYEVDFLGLIIIYLAVTWGQNAQPSQSDDR